MTDPLNSPPPPGEPDPTIRPRAVASRHFRKPPPEGAAATPADHAPAANEDEELEQLTRQFKDLVGRKKPPVAEPPPEEDARVRRKPMPRSGNLNVSMMLGEAPDPSAAPPPGYNLTAAQTEPAHLTLPPGFAAMAWKLGSVALVMLGLGYFLAWWIHRPPPAVPQAAVAPPPAPSVWRAPTMEVLDAALAADQAGDTKKAIKLLVDLAATEPNLPGLARYRAVLELGEGNFVLAERELLALGNAGRELPQVLYLRAMNASRQRHFDDAAKMLLSSLVLDPLPADTYYQMAELLRRQGKLPDAVVVARQALLRAHPAYGISRATISLKQRLAQIEGGQTAEVEAALAEAMKSPPLAPDWMFTAAALGLQRGDRAAAAEWLGKARSVLPRDEFNAWVDDYFFRQQTTSADLAAFRLTEDERRRRWTTSWDFFIDP